jgi:hypothetical protein
LLAWVQLAEPPQKRAPAAWALASSAVVTVVVVQSLSALLLGSWQFLDATWLYQ